MRRGPQPDGLRPKMDQPVILVMRLVVQRDVDGHNYRYASIGSAPSVPESFFR